MAITKDEEKKISAMKKRFGAVMGDSVAALAKKVSAAEGDEAIAEKNKDATLSLDSFAGEQHLEKLA